ncbi:hypothetical protein QYM46_13055 [Brevibacterium sp. K11IcPPYGO002]|uniref:hypothetical protein n=1 Tax=Brevibacterium sp. K11IcPPYGO002 TaxID=3058837 RepID=UPI003D813EB3
MTADIKAWVEERRAIIHGAREAIRPVEAIDLGLTDLPRALDALNAVLKVHSPGDVFKWADDCADPENHHLFTDVRTGDMLCEVEPVGRFCNGCVPEKDTMIDVDEYPWPCPTVQAVDSALEGTIG